MQDENPYASELVEEAPIKAEAVKPRLSRLGDALLGLAAVLAFALPCGVCIALGRTDPLSHIVAASLGFIGLALVSHLESRMIRRGW
jgi:hypothetical protein